MEKLPSEHKARWLAGATLNTSDQAMASVLSTALPQYVPCIRNASLPLFHRVSIRIPLLLLVFGRTWCFNDGGIHDRPFLEDRSTVGQVFLLREQRIFHEGGC